MSAFSLPDENESDSDHHSVASSTTSTGHGSDSGHNQQEEQLDLLLPPPVVAVPSKRGWRITNRDAAKPRQPKAKKQVTRHSPPSLAMSEVVVVIPPVSASIPPRQSSRPSNSSHSSSRTQASVSAAAMTVTATSTQTFSNTQVQPDGTGTCVSVTRTDSTTRVTKQASAAFSGNGKSVSSSSSSLSSSSSVQFNVKTTRTNNSNAEMTLQQWFEEYLKQLTLREPRAYLNDDDYDALVRVASDRTLTKNVRGTLNWAGRIVREQKVVPVKYKLDSGAVVDRVGQLKVQYKGRTEGITADHVRIIVPRSDTVRVAKHLQKLIFVSARNKQHRETATDTMLRQWQNVTMLIVLNKLTK
ncbi:MAG: hypothetical protein ACREHG_09605 [Candidatus Saccharimonadales bacterium]